MRGQPWTANDDDVLRRLWGKASCAEIAAKVKRTKGSVIGRANRLGLERLPSLDRGARVWTADDNAKLLAMRALGCTFPAIAAVLGRTPAQCCTQHTNLYKRGRAA